MIESLCSLAGTVKIKTMKGYSAGVMSYQLDLGIDCKAFSDTRLEKTIQGIKHDDNDPEWGTRTRLTRTYLLKVLAPLPSNYYEDIVKVQGPSFSSSTATATLLPLYIYYLHNHNCLE